MTQTRRSFFGTAGAALLGVLAAVYVPSVVAQAGDRRIVQDFICRATGAYAVWCQRLTWQEVELLHKGVSPLRVRPAALQFYAPMYAGIVDG